MLVGVFIALAGYKFFTPLNQGNLTPYKGKKEP